MGFKAKHTNAKQIKAKQSDSTRTPIGLLRAQQSCLLLGGRSTAGSSTTTPFAKRSRGGLSLLSSFSLSCLLLVLFGVFLFILRITFLAFSF